MIYPKAHISIFEVYFLHPSRSSGALYHLVTTLCVSFPVKLGRTRLARPKSAILTSPLLLMRMFAPDELKGGYR